MGDAAFEELWRLRLEETPPWPFEWLRHQRRDDYWRHGSLCEDWASIEVPVLAIGGWQDGYRDACLALLANGRSPRRAMIGPWGHARPHRGWPAPASTHPAGARALVRALAADDPNGVDEEPDARDFIGPTARPASRAPAHVPGRGARGAPGRPPAAHAASCTSAPTATSPTQPPPTPRAPDLGRPALRRRIEPWWCSGSPPGGGRADMRPDDAASLTWDTPPLDDR